MEKTERLLNLVIALLATRYPVSLERIHRAVPGYPPLDPDDSAFRRMFERDKAELRSIGIPLEAVVDPLWGDEIGYQIAQPDYALPQISFTADESAVVALAMSLWTAPGLRDAAEGARRKLAAAGVDTRSPVDDPRVDSADAGFSRVILDALIARQPVTFRYRGAGRTTAETRTVEPWGVVSWHGRWYLAGFDRARKAPRVFRLSRVFGAIRPTDRPGSVNVPEDVDIRALVTASAEQAGAPVTATLRIAPGRARALRRDADRIVAGDDDDLASFTVTDLPRFAAFVAGFGPDVLALDPPELVERVQACLRGFLAGQGSR